MDTEHAYTEHRTPEQVAELMEGHAERVAAHMAERAKPSAKPHGVTVRRRDQRPTPTMAELTGAQRHKRLAGVADIELNRRIMDSPLWDNKARSRRSWCALLRELELHPERLDAIRAKMARQTGATALPEVADEVTA
jgi:hypothetical protein